MDPAIVKREFKNALASGCDIRNASVPRPGSEGGESKGVRE